MNVFAFFSPKYFWRDYDYCCTYRLTNASKNIYWIMQICWFFFIQIYLLSRLLILRVMLFFSAPPRHSSWLRLWLSVAFPNARTFRCVHVQITCIKKKDFCQSHAVNLALNPCSVLWINLFFLIIHCTQTVLSEEVCLKNTSGVLH